MSVILDEDYKKLSDCAERFGRGLGSVFNTGDCDSYREFSRDFNRSASRLDTIKLAGCYVAHWLTGKFKDSQLYHRAKIYHAEAMIPVAMRAFGEDRVAQAIAVEDRTAKMLDLCVRSRSTGLAALIQRSLSR